MTKLWSGILNALWLTAIMMLIFCVLRRPFLEDKPTDKDYVRAIVGEASNQPEGTQVCVAHALRNRGNLKGVYGYSAKHVWSENDRTWKKAWVAWELSGQEKEDPIQGATSFGTAEDLFKTFGAKAAFVMGSSIQCGDFYFYKPNKVEVLK